MIDRVGQDISKPIPPMDIYDWEDMQIVAEMPSVGLFGPGDINEIKKECEMLALSVMKMSQEIRRLRLTYGEPIWTSVYHTKEEDDEIRRVHENEKGKNKA